MPKLKRNRKIRTCEYCYHHKLKCDRNSPCSTCVRTKSECVYQFRGGNESDNLSSEETSAKTTKRGQTVSDITKSPKSDYSLSVSPKSDENVIRWKKDNGNITIEESNSDIVFSTNINNMPLYYSRAFFPYLEPSLNRMVLFKMSEIGERSSIGGNFSHVGTYDFQRFGFKASLEQLVKEYPKKKEFDDIIYIYWDNIHPLIPVIDKESTMVKYIKFWDELQDETSPKFDIDSGVLFLAMLIAVKTAYEVNVHDPEKLNKLQIEKNKVYDTFEKFKLFFGFKTNPNITFIQSSIILYQSSCIYFMGIFTFTAALARQAEFMGMHRDPLLHDVFPNNSNPREVEVRRIVWHYVRYLDTATSGVSGMSPHMIMTNASTKFPSKREYNSVSGKFDGDLNPFMIFTISRFKCSLVMETISHYLNSDFSSDTEKLLRWEGISRTVIALYQDVFTLVKEILSCSTNPKYSQSLLRFLVSNAITNIHRTYLLHRACDRRPYSHHNRVILKPANAANVELTKLSQASSSNDFFEKVLTIRMPYYESTMEVSILLLYESKYRLKLTPELEKFRWFSKNANPLQYTYFVLRDIHHYPDKRYNFTHIPQDIKNFIIDEEALKFEGDIRRYVVDITITNLANLKDYWSEPISDVMNFLCELQRYVYRIIDKGASGTSSEKKTNTNQTQEDDSKDGSSSGAVNEVDSETAFDFDKYKNIIDIISGLSGGVGGAGAGEAGNPLDPTELSQSQTDEITPVLLNHQSIPGVSEENKINSNSTSLDDSRTTTMNGMTGSSRNNSQVPSSGAQTSEVIPSVDLSHIQQQNNQYTQKQNISPIPFDSSTMYHDINPSVPIVQQNSVYGTPVYNSVPYTMNLQQMPLQNMHPQMQQQPLMQQMQPLLQQQMQQQMQPLMQQQMQPMMQPQLQQQLQPQLQQQLQQQLQPTMQQFQSMQGQRNFSTDSYNPQLQQVHPNGMIPQQMMGGSPYMAALDSTVSQTGSNVNSLFSNINQQPPTYR